MYLNSILNPFRAIPVKVAAKRLPVFPFSGFDLYHHFQNDAFYDFYNLDYPWAGALAYERGNPAGWAKVWTAFDRVPIKVRALLSGSRHFVNAASFVYLAKEFVHLQGYLAHKRQRPPKTLR